MEEGASSPKGRGKTLLIVSFAVVAVLVIILAVVLTLPAPDTRLVRVEARDVLLTQEELPDWVQLGIMSHGVASPGWNMTEIDGLSFLNYTGLGDNYTLSIELYQFSTINNATFFHDHGLMPRFEHGINASLVMNGTKVVRSDPGIGTNSSLFVLSIDTAHLKYEYGTLTFQQRNIICQITVGCPSGTVDLEGLIKDIAALQNEKIMKNLS